MLPVSKGGLPSFLYPISYRTHRFCIHFKTPGLPHKRGQMRSKLTNIPIQICLDIPGEASTGAEPERQRGTKWSHTQPTQGSSALYCSSREGHQATCQSWLSLVGWPGDRGWGQETNQPAWKSHQYRQKAIHTAIAPSTVRYKLMLVL